MSLLQNEEGDYPWQTVRWPIGIMYFCALPAVALLEDGMAVEGFFLGFSFLVFMALVAWKWPV